MNQTRMGSAMKIGDYVALWMTGDAKRYIAEITQVEPLKVKIQERGPFSKLKDGDFIILQEETRRLNDESLCQATLRQALENGHPFISGLKSLGICDNNLYEIWPVEEEETQ